MSNPELTGEPSPFDQKARAVARLLTPRPGEHASATRKIARGLGWFSIGLGLLELLAARQMARLVGLQGNEALLGVTGMREIVNGIGILASRSPKATSGWIWARVVGDGLDLATLGLAAVARPAAGGHPVAAMVAVAGTAALDMTCATTLGHEARAARQIADYSDRSGIRASPDEMRGAALATFTQPPDMRVSPLPPGKLH